MLWGVGHGGFFFVEQCWVRGWSSAKCELQCGDAAPQRRLYIQQIPSYKHFRDEIHRLFPLHILSPHSMEGYSMGIIRRMDQRCPSVWGTEISSLGIQPHP